MRLLVYGTLKKGFFNHTRYGFGEKSKFLGAAEVNGYSLVQPERVPFPYCIANCDGTVKGELYDVPDDVIQSLDYMEAGAGYKRVQVTLTNAKKAYIYVDGTNRTYEGLKRFSEFKK